MCQLLCSYLPDCRYWTFVEVTQINFRHPRSGKRGCFDNETFVFVCQTNDLFINLTSLKVILKLTAVGSGRVVLPKNSSDKERGKTSLGVVHK